MMAQDLSVGELTRYSRHLLLPEVGLAGQRKLKDAAVLIVGAGGLGSSAAMYLAAAGVGRIGIVDYDRVELSNLQRQVIHSSSDIGSYKVVSAQRRMLEINPEIKVQVYPQALTADNAWDISSDYDILLDGSDNFATRYVINDLCVLTGRPFVYGAVYRFEGQVSVFDARVGPCYRCIFPEPPDSEAALSCADAGVMGILPGWIGVMQAAEVLKLVLGIGSPLTGRLALADGLDFSVQTVALRKNPSCPACGDHSHMADLMDYPECGGAPLPERIADGTNRLEITPVELAELMKQGAPFRLVDVRRPDEVLISRLPGAELIPVDQLPGELDRFSLQERIIVFCRTGMRAMRAQQMLLQAGFRHVLNLRGGINAWAAEVDPSVRVY